MPTESAPLCDGAKIDTTEAANAPVQKPFPEQSRAKTDVIHQFFDPQDVGCIKTAANGTMSHGSGSTAGKDLATKQAMFEELGKEFKCDPTLLIPAAPKDTTKISTTRKPLSFDDPNEENADEEEDESDEEYDEDDEDEEQDDEDEEQGDSEDDEDDHEQKHHGDEYEDDDEFSEPPAKKKK